MFSIDAVGAVLAHGGTSALARQQWTDIKRTGLTGTSSEEFRRA
jgi:hypothetical protein